MQFKRVMSSQKPRAEKRSPIATEPPKTKGRADGDYPAHAVMHGQAVIKPVIRSHAGKAGKPMRPQNNLAMTDFGGFAEACCS